MHPVLFELPFVGLPVRLFGLFIINAFFLSTMWTQWKYASIRIPAVCDDAGLRRAFRILIGGAVLQRVVWIALPGVSWGVVVVGVLLVDFALEFYVWLKWSKAQKAHAKDDSDFVFNLGFWLLVTGFVGSRIFWVFTTDIGRQTFVESPLRALVAVWDGGIVYYGGLLCAAAYGAWYLWWKNRNIMELGDVVGVAVALTLFIGRWACFSAGDDFGKPTDMPWGVVFPVDPQSQIPVDQQGITALHPTQLYMSLNGLVIFLVLCPLLSRKKFQGQVFYLFLMLYSVGRSIIEHFRGDTGRGLYEVTDGVSLSSSQLISIPVLVAALLLYVRAWRKSRKAGDSPAPEESAAG